MLLAVLALVACSSDDAAPVATDPTAYEMGFGDGGHEGEMLPIERLRILVGRFDPGSAGR